MRRQSEEELLIIIIIITQSLIRESEELPPPPLTCACVRLRSGSWCRRWVHFGPGSEGRTYKIKDIHFYSSTAVEYFDLLSDQISVFSPAEAEESKVESQQRGHHMSDDRTGFTGMEEETKPEGRQQSTELTNHEVHLQRHGGDYLLQVTEPCSISDISAAKSRASDIHRVWAPSCIQESGSPPAERPALPQQSDRLSSSRAAGAPPASHYWYQQNILYTLFIMFVHNVIYYVMFICVFVAFCILCAPIAVKQLAPLGTNKGIDWIRSVSSSEEEWNCFFFCFCVDQRWSSS